MPTEKVPGNQLLRFLTGFAAGLNQPHPESRDRGLISDSQVARIARTATHKLPPNPASPPHISLLERHLYKPTQRPSLRNRPVKNILKTVLPFTLYQIYGLQQSVAV